MKNVKNNLKLIIAGVGVLVILIIALLAVFVWIPHYRERDIAQQDESLAALLSDEDQGERREIVDLSGEEPEAPGQETDISASSKIPDGNFQVTMTTEWNYPNIDTPAEDSYVENAVNNTLDTKFKVVLADNENVVIYESPRLPVGSYTSGIPIKTELAPGKYNCIVIYNLFVPNTDEGAGTVRVGLVINIGG